MKSWSDDRSSGSSDVALAFLRDLERSIDIDTSATAPALRAGLLTRLRAALASQPTMAIVHQLAARALAVADAGVAREDSAADLRVQLVRSCAAEQHDLVAALEAVARTAAGLIERRDTWVATLSASRVVREAVIAAHAAGRHPHALIGEGRPGFEGREMAAAVAGAGIPVWLVADAALPLLLSQTAMVWIGADAVTERGVINKIGSYAAALAAREHSVPVYALAGQRKFLPAGTGALRILEMPPSEIWDAPPEGVEPRNVYFELVPLELLRGVVVEDAVLPPAEAASLARERALPAELAGDRV